MSKQPQHQCLIYKGTASRNLPALAATIQQKLNDNFRCLYLHSPAMVSAMKYYLAAAGVRVDEQVEQNRLILSSSQSHLVDGHFDIDRMIETLDDALNKALRDGYQGLWASGDMTWEFGSQKDFSKLLEYEWRLEEYFRSHPALSGVCQYHADTLPLDVIKQGLLAHPIIFQNATLSRINPQFLEPRSYTYQTADNPELDHAVEYLYEP